MHDLEDAYTEILEKTHAYLVFGPAEVRKEIRGIIDHALNFYQRNCEHDLMQVYSETMEYIEDVDRKLDISTREKIYSFNRNKTTLTQDIENIRKMIFKMQDQHEKDMKELRNFVPTTSTLDHDNVNFKPPQKETYEELIIRKLVDSKKSVNEIMDLTGLDYDKARKAVTRLYRKGLLERSTVDEEVRYNVKK